jgi:hypothetical protein
VNLFRCVDVSYFVENIRWHTDTPSCRLLPEEAVVIVVALQKGHCILLHDRLAQLSSCKRAQENPTMSPMVVN